VKREKQAVATGLQTTMLLQLQESMMVNEEKMMTWMKAKDKEMKMLTMSLFTRTRSTWNSTSSANGTPQKNATPQYESIHTPETIVATELGDRLKKGKEDIARTSSSNTPPVHRILNHGDKSDEYEILILKKQHELDLLRLSQNRDTLKENNKNNLAAFAPLHSAAFVPINSTASVPSNSAVFAPVTFTAFASVNSAATAPL
jgi:hypothetical protein